MTNAQNQIKIDVRAYPIAEPKNNTVAFASVTINDMIAINGIRVVDGANGLFTGTPGSGKSFSAKREIVNVFLMTEDDIIISDPEGEYHPIVTRLGGQVVKLSPNSAQYINPMDINPDYSDEVVYCKGCIYRTTKIYKAKGSSAAS